MVKTQKYRKLYLTCLWVIALFVGGLGYWNYRQNALAHAGTAASGPTNFDECVAAGSRKSSAATLDSTDSKLVCSWWDPSTKTIREFTANSLPVVKTISAPTVVPVWSDVPLSLRSEIVKKSVRSCQFRQLTLDSTGDAVIRVRMADTYAIVSVSCDANYFYMYKHARSSDNWEEVVDTISYMTCGNLVANRVPVEMINFSFDTSSGASSKYATCLDDRKIPHKVVAI